MPESRRTSCDMLIRVDEPVEAVASLDLVDHGRPAWSPTSGLWLDLDCAGQNCGGAARCPALDGLESDDADPITRVCGVGVLNGGLGAASPTRAVVAAHDTDGAEGVFSMRPAPLRRARIAAAAGLASRHVIA